MSGTSERRKRSCRTSGWSRAWLASLARAVDPARQPCNCIVFSDNQIASLTIHGIDRVILRPFDDHRGRPERFALGTPERRSCRWHPTAMPNERRWNSILPVCVTVREDSAKHPIVSSVTSTHRRPNGCRHGNRHRHQRDARCRHVQDSNYSGLSRRNRDTAQAGFKLGSH
jgi:hypothetical protein